MVTVYFQQSQCNWTDLVSSLVRQVWGSSSWSTCSSYNHDGFSHFRGFISASVVSDDPSNADTKVNKMCSSTPLRILDYVSNLYGYVISRDWMQVLGEIIIIAVQGLADMLHVIISTINSDMDLIRTSHDTSAGVVHLGLIGQFHFQVLERVD